MNCKIYIYTWKGIPGKYYIRMKKSTLMSGTCHCV